jgi:hypothetical protein
MVPVKTTSSIVKIVMILIGALLTGCGAEDGSSGSDTLDFRMVSPMPSESPMPTPTPTPTPMPTPSPMPRPPLAVNDTAAYFFDHTAYIIGDTYSNDVAYDGATIVPTTVVIVMGAMHGMVMVDPNNGRIIYTPNTIPATAEDSFTYRVKDSLGRVSNNATVTLSSVGRR